MNLQTLLYQVKDQVATITLNRPQRRNAYTALMQRELVQVFDATDADDAVRAVIVTGAGDNFCAGFELSGGSESFDPKTLEDDSNGMPSRFNADGSVNYSSASNRDIGGVASLRIFQSLKPVIGAVNGPAVGIGATIQLPMDIRLACETARFGFVFARRGVVPEAASSWFLPRIVSPPQALEWCLTGRVFGAAEALAGGLIRSIHPAAELLPAAHALAREIVENTSAVSVALIRQMMWRGLGQQHPIGAHRIESRLLVDRGMSDDCREGVASFLQKRRAVFPDRVSEDMPPNFPWWEAQEDAW
jgi:enoyl-CoA hydratase/carnithine racemase